MTWTGPNRHKDSNDMACTVLQQVIDTSSQTVHIARNRGDLGGKLAGK